MAVTFRAEVENFPKHTIEVVQFNAVDQGKFDAVGSRVRYWMETKESVRHQGTWYEELLAEGFVSEASDDGDVKVKWLGAVKRRATMTVDHFDYAETVHMSLMRDFIKAGSGEEGGCYQLVDASQVSNVFDMYRFTEQSTPGAPSDRLITCLDAQLEKLPTTVVTLSACSLAEEGRVQSTLVSMSGEETVITCDANARLPLTIAWLISEYRQANLGHGLTKIKIVDSAAQVIGNDVQVEALIQ